MRIAELYDNAECSDLTIRLSDGSDIYVHKVIICSKNTTLRRLCQVCKPCCDFSSEMMLTRSLSQNNLSILELADDDALAAEVLIRHLYEHKLDELKGHWSFWLDVRAVARKYGQKSLRSTTGAKLRQTILQLLEDEEDGELLRFVAVIEQYHADDKCLSKIAKILRREPEFH